MDLGYCILAIFGMALCLFALGTLALLAWDEPGEQDPEQDANEW